LIPTGIVFREEEEILLFGEDGLERILPDRL